MDESNKKLMWIIIIAVVATALIVGGAMYAWQRSNSKSMENNIMRQVSSLQSQISQLQQTIIEEDQVISEPDQTSMEEPSTTDDTDEKADKNGDIETVDQTITDSDLDYVNRQGGYGFNHPNDWTVETNGSSAYINGYKFAGVGITSFQGTIEEYLAHLGNNTPAKISDKETVNIAYTKAVKYMQSDYSPEGLHYLVTGDDKIISLYLTSTTAEDIKKFETIIDSFTLFK